MRVVICFIACIIGYTAATLCTTTSDCDSTVTHCGGQTTLQCVNTGTEMHCVCQGGNNNNHTCASAADCHNQNLHHCRVGHWACVNSHCHCTGGNGRK